MTIHPKTSAAGLGGALGVVIVSVLASIHGIHLTPEANAAIPTFLGLLGSWLVPLDAPIPSPTPPPATPPPIPPPTPAPAPPPPPPPSAPTLPTP